MAKGFFTDTTLCIGCKACEVACKQWNQLPADNFSLAGMSYDNTVQLSATTWRHVTFLEQFDHSGHASGAALDGGAQAISARIQQHPPLVDMANGKLLGEQRWLMMSDVCKHCTNAGCLQACPTGAIIRNEFDDVYVQPDICNGCGYCVPACPFGVIDLQKEDGRAWKCTLCFDRQKEGMTPACAKACPTQSILFGDLDELRARAEERVGMLHARGISDAYIYGGLDERTSVGPLNAFFLLVDQPQAYNLPEKAHLPQSKVIPAYAVTALAAAFFGAATLLTVLAGGRRT